MRARSRRNSGEASSLTSPWGPMARATERVKGRSLKSREFPGFLNETREGKGTTLQTPLNLETEGRGSLGESGQGQEIPSLEIFALDGQGGADIFHFGDAGESERTVPEQGPNRSHFGERGLDLGYGRSSGQKGPEGFLVPDPARAPGEQGAHRIPFEGFEARWIGQERRFRVRVHERVGGQS